MSLETFSLYLFVGENAERSLNRFYYLRNCPAKYFAAIFSTIGENGLSASQNFFLFSFLKYNCKSRCCVINLCKRVSIDFFLGAGAGGGGRWQNELISFEC